MIRRPKLHGKAAKGLCADRLDAMNQPFPHACFAPARLRPSVTSFAAR